MLGHNCKFNVHEEVVPLTPYVRDNTANTWSVLREILHQHILAVVVVVVVVAEVVAAAVAAVVPW